MARSTEYPDLPFVEPASWTDANRTSVQVVVIHTTEGSSHALSAEDGAAYDARRTDGTSTHYFHDSTSTVQCVRTEDIAHTARRQGNLRGIHHELCAKAGYGASWWADDYAEAMLRRAAKQVARDCRKWNIPVRKLSASEVADGTRGICGHVHIALAFPQDGGDHTDPGPNFPWSRFIDMVRAEINSGGNPIMGIFDSEETFRAYMLSLMQTQVPAGVEKAVTTDPQTRDAITSLAEKAQENFLWDGIHALREDAVYVAAPDTGEGSKKEMRARRDTFMIMLRAAIEADRLDDGTPESPYAGTRPPREEVPPA